MQYRVLLIEGNRMMLERLTAVIRDTKDFELAGRYQKAGDALKQGGVFHPNLILLDAEVESNVALIPEFGKAFPSVPVLCMNTRWNAESASHLVQAGAQGYLLKPFTRIELKEAVDTFAKGNMGASSCLIAFFSPKGKSGKTTLIANLALSLAAKTGDSVGIIDADLQFSDMSVFFNLAPQSTIVEAVRDVHFLSPVTLKPYYMPVTDRVSVLCGTKKPEYAEMVETKKFADVLAMSRNLFRYLLVDLPPGFGPISIAAAESSDMTILTASLNGGFEMLQMKRALEIFHDWDDFDERVRAVFTRVSPCNEETRPQLEQIVGCRVAGIVPNEYKLVSEAADNGRMAHDISPDSPLMHSINTIADRIISSQKAV